MSEQTIKESLHIYGAITVRDKSVQYSRPFLDCLRVRGIRLMDEQPNNQLMLYAYAAPESWSKMSKTGIQFTTKPETVQRRWIDSEPLRIERDVVVAVEPQEVTEFSGSLGDYISSIHFEPSVAQ